MAVQSPAFDVTKGSTFGVKQHLLLSFVPIILPCLVHDTILLLTSSPVQVSVTMGRRKSTTKKMSKKKKNVLSTTFKCPFCCHDNVVQCKM